MSVLLRGGVQTRVHSAIFGVRSPLVGGRSKSLDRTIINNRVKGNCYSKNAALKRVRDRKVISSMRLVCHYSIDRNIEHLDKLINRHKSSYRIFQVSKFIITLHLETREWRPDCPLSKRLLCLGERNEVQQSINQYNHSLKPSDPDF